MSSAFAPLCPENSLALIQDQQKQRAVRDMSMAHGSRKNRMVIGGGNAWAYRLLLWVAIFAAVLLLAACQRQADGPAAIPEDDSIGLALYGLDYTDVPIGVFYVNGTWGGNVSPYAAGYGSAGGISLPAQWKPGTKVKVQWRDDRLYAQDRTALMTAEVEVPEYGRIYSGFLLVAFLPGRQVKVYASGKLPGHPQAPAGLMNPGEFCNQQPGCPEWYDAGLPPREGHY